MVLLARHSIYSLYLIALLLLVARHEMVGGAEKERSWALSLLELILEAETESLGCCWWTEMVVRHETWTQKNPIDACMVERVSQSLAAGH